MMHSKTCLFLFMSNLEFDFKNTLDLILILDI